MNYKSRQNTALRKHIPLVANQFTETKSLAKIKPDCEVEEATNTFQPLKIRPAEARLYEVASRMPGEQVVVISAGRAQSAAMVSMDRTKSTVFAWYLDSYRCQLASEHALADEARNAGAKLNHVCSANWPLADKPADLIMLEQPKTGEAELGREYLQIGWDNLKIGGALVVATDNPKDKWLLEQMQVFEKSIKVRKFDDATVYYAIKQKPLKRLRDFACQLAFRDEGNLLQLITRPSVFAHRKLDTGARHIMDNVEVFPDSQLIEIGCGSGAVSMALAIRDASAHVLAIDSNARAIDCLKQSLELNGIQNVVAEVNHDGQLGDREGQFDMALANPPYYADFRIAQHFIETSLRALRPGGRLMLVSRKPQWYRDNLGQWLEDCEVFECRRYHIATGVKPAVETIS